MSRARKEERRDVKKTVCSAFIILSLQTRAGKLNNFFKRYIYRPRDADNVLHIIHLYAYYNRYTLHRLLCA